MKTMVLPVLAAGDLSALQGKTIAGTEITKVDVQMVPDGTPMYRLHIGKCVDVNEAFLTKAIPEMDTDAGVPADAKISPLPSKTCFIKEGCQECLPSMTAAWVKQALTTDDLNPEKKELLTVADWKDGKYTPITAVNVDAWPVVTLSIADDKSFDTTTKEVLASGSIVYTIQDNLKSNIAQLLVAPGDSVPTDEFVHDIKVINEHQVSFTIRSAGPTCAPANCKTISDLKEVCGTPVSSVQVEPVPDGHPMYRIHIGKCADLTEQCMAAAIQDIVALMPLTPDQKMPPLPSKTCYIKEGCQECLPSMTAAWVKQALTTDDLNQEKKELLTVADWKDGKYTPITAVNVDAWPVVTLSIADDKSFDTTTKEVIASGSIVYTIQHNLRDNIAQLLTPTGDDVFTNEFIHDVKVLNEHQVSFTVKSAGPECKPEGCGSPQEGTTTAQPDVTTPQPDGTTPKPDVTTPKPDVTQPDGQTTTPSQGKTTGPSSTSAASTAAPTDVPVSSAYSAMALLAAAAVLL